MERVLGLWRSNAVNHAINSSVEELDEKVEGLDEKVEELDKRVEGLDEGSRR
jgi:hypothetical protein